MKKLSTLLVVLLVLLLLPVVGSAKKKDETKATPNLSFPLIATDIIQLFYLQTWVDADGDGVVDDSEWVLDYDLDDDEHYIMSTGCMVQELNQNKLELTGIIGDSTYIDVLVVRPSGGKKTK